MQATYQALERALNTLASHVLAGPEFREELDRARLLYFTPGSRPIGAEEGAEARFLEWFCLEQRLSSGSRPFEEFIEAGCPGLDLEGEAHAHLFRWSLTGIFQVVAECELAWLTTLDPVSGEHHRLYWPPGMSAKPVIGGALLGRLYRLPGEQAEGYLPSPALVLYQGSDLGRALLEDAAKARRFGYRLSLGQLDLERLLSGERPPDPQALGPLLGLADLEERIQLLFERHGFVGLTARELSRQSASEASFDAVFKELLDELAFDTDVDLDELRRLFLQLWTVARAQGPSPSNREQGPKQTGTWADPERPCPCGSGQPYLECHLGKDLVGRLREAEASNRKLTPVFEGLGDLLDEEEPEEIMTPFEEGLVELHGLVEEYLWEKGLAPGDPGAEMLQAFLAHLEARSASTPALRAEDLVGGPLIGWLLHRFLALPLHQGGPFLAQARDLWPALAAWLEREHGFRLGPKDFLANHLHELERALQARGDLSRRASRTQGEPTTSPGVFQVVESSRPGVLALSPWPGLQEVKGVLDPDGATLLRVGDLLWGRPIQTGQGIGFDGSVRVGPVESLEFLEEGESASEY